MAAAAARWPWCRACSPRRCPTSAAEHPRSLYRRGDCFSFGASHIHDVQHAAGDPAASLHAYSPPLGEMGFYEPDDGGTLTRRPGDSDEEFC